MMKEKALKNLLTLHIIPDAITSLKNDGHVWCSERTAMNIAGKKVLAGITYDADQEGYTYYSEAQKALKQVRDDGYYPFHIAKAGDMFAVLFVTEDEGEITSRDKVSENEFDLVAYVYNSADPDLSEYGHICARSVNGGLIRIY